MASGEEDSDELLRQFVLEALLTKSAGTGTALFDQLVGEACRLKQGLQQPLVSQDPAAADQLTALLRAVTRCLSALHERKHEQLLSHLLDIPLWQAPPTARLATLHFIGHAVVASGALVQSCLHTLVYSLLPPPAPAAPDPFPGQSWVPLPAHAATQDDVLAATERVLQLVPTSASRLLPLLASNLPHKLRDRNSHCLYLRALFHLAESPAGAALREGVLATVVDHLINVDVEIRWEDIVEEATEEAKEEEGGGPPEEEPDIFELEGMSELELATAAADAAAADDDSDAMARGGWEGSHARATAAPAGAEAVAGGGPPPAVDETADKLDSLMELTLAHLERRVQAGQLPATWDTALAAFERTVLHTHRSKFTQFLLFYLARQAPDTCARSLLHSLLARTTDRQQPPITRSAAAAYAASFLARAAYIPEPLVVESLQRLTDWCLRYAREEDRRGGLPPIPSSSALPLLATDARTRHVAFYAACQALLYALCYHMDPLLRRCHRSRAASAAAAAGGAAEEGPHANGFANGQVNGSLEAGVAHHLQQQQNGVGPVPAAPPEEQQQQEEEQMLDACAASVAQLFAEDMPRLLTHPLDPLSSCARSVVTEFARQAQAAGFPHLASLVRRWERQRAAGGSKHVRPLEVFFPFDPYLLRRSAVPLELATSYVCWRRGHPSGAPRAGLTGGSDLEDDEDVSDGGSDGGEAMSEGEGAALDDLDASSLDSSGLSSSDDTSSDSDSGDESTSSDEMDGGLKRTRFGSVPGSSLSSGGRRHPKRHLPGALKASIANAGGSGSPTMGFHIPGGSYSTDNGSPWGVSPSTGVAGAAFAPMSFTGRR